jgi:hypothetical protein
MILKKPLALYCSLEEVHFAVDDVGAELEVVRAADEATTRRCTGS